MVTRRLTGFCPSYFVASELRRLARRHLRGERAGHSLQAAALVNEAYMRLVDYKRMQWRDRAHFFAVSAQLMRRILVDHARRHNLKRGGGVQHVSLEQAAFVGGGQSEDLVALDEAIDELAGFDARKAQVGEEGLWFWSDARRFALVASGHMYKRSMRSIGRPRDDPTP